MLVAASCPQLKAVTHSDLSSTVSDLHAKVFSRDFNSHDAVGAETVIDQLQDALFKGMSACYYLKEKSFSSTNEKRRLQESIDKLRQELNDEKAKVVEVKSKITSKDKDITCLKKQMHDLDLVISGLRAEKAALQDENTSPKADAVFEASGAILKTRWEMMKDWEDKKTSDWDVSVAEDIYNKVKVVQAKVKGLSQGDTAASPKAVNDNCATDNGALDDSTVADTVPTGSADVVLS
ncbi:unnamed protein product [Arabidopsis halleri]